MKHVVIIGGGITGLAAAYRLHMLAQEAALPLDLTLIEREPRLGGKIVTERVDGPSALPLRLRSGQASDAMQAFVVEGGPDTFLAYKPWGVALCEELGLADRLLGTNQQQRKTYVMWDGRLHRLPEGLTGMIPTSFGPMAKTTLISPLGKARMALDFVISPRPDDGDETLADFISRRLGREVYDRLIEPLMGGIYAGDGGQLSLAATFPQLRKLELEHGGLIKGMLAARKNGSRRPTQNGHSRSAFLTPRTGLAEIVERLAERLAGAQLLTGAEVTSVRPEHGGFQVDFRSLRDFGSLKADAIIFATPAFATARLMDAFDPTLAATLSEIPYVSTATVSVAYPLSDVPRPLDGYGYVIPRVEGHDILACTWTSTKFPHRAPEGYALLRAFVGRAGQQAALAGSDDDLLQLVRAEFERTLGITASPLFHRIFRWPDAMPQYTLGHPERLAQIERRLAAHPGLFVAGAAYRGIGIPDCINSGESAAKQALTFLLETTNAQHPTFH